MSRAGERLGLYQAWWNVIGISDKTYVTDWTQTFHKKFIFGRVIRHFYISSYLTEMCVVWWLFSNELIIRNLNLVTLQSWTYLSNKSWKLMSPMFNGVKKINLVSNVGRSNNWFLVLKNAKPKSCTRKDKSDVKAGGKRITNVTEYESAFWDTIVKSRCQAWKN